MDKPKITNIQNGIVEIDFPIFKTIRELVYFVISDEKVYYSCRYSHVRTERLISFLSSLANSVGDEVLASFLSECLQDGTDPRYNNLFEPKDFPDKLDGPTSDYTSEHVQQILGLVSSIYLVSEFGLEDYF